MPLPTPKAKEDQKEFINRCVTDDTMITEYPRKDQRLAVCYTQWKNKLSFGAIFFASMLYVLKILYLW
jgi:hypothetical protein